MDDRTVPTLTDTPAPPPAAGRGAPGNPPPPGLPALATGAGVLLLLACPGSATAQKSPLADVTGLEPDVIEADAGGAAGDQPPEEMLESIQSLSLEQLLNPDVLSASKRLESLFDTAAAAYVISNEDIRRSGSRSIAEALRMAPGLTVGQIDSNKWAISSRGFADRFSNKLLVMIDGRTVFTPSFSGVFWDTQHYPLEDIERIEVIRGPGGTLWGANAVNGVVNVITKDAARSKGAYLNVGGGSPMEQAFASARYGGNLGEADFRTYFDFFQRDGTPLDKDTWDNFQTGFRIDWDDVDQHVTFQGDYYWGDRNQVSNFINPTLTPIPGTFPPRYVRKVKEGYDVSGGNVLFRYDRTLENESDLTFQAYYDYVSRDEIHLKGYRHTFDAEVQHRFDLGESHDIIWGLGYRVMPDHFDNPNPIDITWDPAETNHQLFNGFIQDDITIVPDVARFIIGAKVEHNDYTEWEFQPNARILIKPTENQTLWASVSRAVQVPQRNLEAVTQTYLPFEPTLVPVDTNGDGIPDATTPLFVVGRGIDPATRQMVDSEELIGWEAGYRIKPADNLTLDLALFYNQYNDRRGPEFFGPSFAAAPSPHLFLISQAANNGSATSYGGELSAQWAVSDAWRVSANYSYLDLDFDGPGGLFAAGKDPAHQANLRSSWDLPWDIDLDLWFRFVDELPAFGIDSYFDFDARIAWHPTETIELALVGQNLLESMRSEFGAPSGAENDATLVERGFYLQASFRF